jgi:DNA-directed RNA polymerase subunit K/omega
MEKVNKIVDFENQAFDDLGINPYEIVIAVSRMARDINDKARKYLPPEQDVNAISVALKRLGKDVRFTYDSEQEETTLPDET